MSKNKKITIVTIFTIALAVLVGTSIAYFTERTNSLDNNVTVGKVDIELTEPNWNPEKAKNIEPDKEILKDPKITNTGKNSAYVYMEVKIPKAEVVTVSDNETLLNKQLQELFIYNINDGWEQIKVSQADDYNIHLYAYTNNVLEANQTTPTLFDKVKFKNVLEGELDTSKEYIIAVKSYAIQSDTIKTQGITNKEKMEYIFENYLGGEND